jgi:oligopeptide transport system permease protein
MIARALRRLSSALATLLVVATVVFVLVRAVPGGPFDRERAVPAAIERQRAARAHLDDPLWKQYASWLSATVLHGDLGPTFRYPNRSVNEIIAASLPVSMELGALALVLALSLGVPLGALGAVRRGAAADAATIGAALLALALPPLALGPLLVQLFALQLRILPVARWEGLRHAILPTLCLALPVAGAVARLTRAGMLEVLGADFIRAARAKGLSETRIALRHALPEALLPVVGFLGPAASGLLVGSVVVERVFDIPGMGRYFVEAAQNRDYNLVTGVALVEAALLLLFNALVDLALARLDPRIGAARP